MSEKDDIMAENQAAENDAFDDDTQQNAALEAEDQTDAADDVEADEAESESSSAHLKALEEQGAFAADYLEELLDIADLGGDLDIDVENDRAMVAIVAEGADLADLKRLVGRDGQVLESLQELTRLAVQQRTGERSRLMLDIANYRADKKRELTAIAEEAVTKVKATGEPVKLDPMNPFERKVCHDVAAAAGCYSESEGASPNRCVVIYLDDSIEDDEE